MVSSYRIVDVNVTARNHAPAEEICAVAPLELHDFSQDVVVVHRRRCRHLRLDDRWRIFWLRLFKQSPPCNKHFIFLRLEPPRI